MSEKLLASTIELRDRLRAFVGAVAEITDCGHDVDAIVRADEAIEAWNRRTPAPEGVAWRTVPSEPTEAMIAAANALWGEGTGVNYVQLEPEDFYAAMLAASPVVPVGVSDQQRAKIELVLVGYRNRITTLDAATDAILAALRPTDTGANHD